MSGSMPSASCHLILPSRFGSPGTIATVAQIVRIWLTPKPTSIAGSFSSLVMVKVTMRLSIIQLESRDRTSARAAPVAGRVAPIHHSVSVAKHRHLVATPPPNKLWSISTRRRSSRTSPVREACRMDRDADMIVSSTHSGIEPINAQADDFCKRYPDPAPRAACRPRRHALRTLAVMPLDSLSICVQCKSVRGLARGQYR